MEDMGKYWIPPVDQFGRFMHVLASHFPLDLPSRQPGNELEDPRVYRQTYWKSRVYIWHNKKYQYKTVFKLQ
jgi:hypothetical protein